MIQALDDSLLNHCQAITQIHHQRIKNKPQNPHKNWCISGQYSLGGKITFFGVKNTHQTVGSLILKGWYTSGSYQNVCLKGIGTTVATFCGYLLEAEHQFLSIEKKYRRV